MRPHAFNTHRSLTQPRERNTRRSTMDGRSCAHTPLREGRNKVKPSHTQNRLFFRPPPPPRHHCSLTLSLFLTRSPKRAQLCVFFAALFLFADSFPPHRRTGERERERQRVCHSLTYFKGDFYSRCLCVPGGLFSEKQTRARVCLNENGKIGALAAALAARH